MTPIETQRLTISRITLDDAPFIMRLMNDPQYLKFIGDRHIRTLKDAEQYLYKGPISSYQKYGFGLFLTRLRAAGTPMGICGLLKRDFLTDVDIGFAFLPEFRGQGYAKEACRAVIDAGRKHFGFKRIVAIVKPDNQKSIALLKKIGLLFENTISPPNETHELALYGVNYDTEN